MREIRIIGISGSLRKASTNTGLLRAVQKIANNTPGLNFEIADISALPFYNADLAALDFPEQVSELVTKCQAADAFVFACPEYNYSMAPALKNALDWLSRAPNNAVLNGKSAALLGAGGMMGSSRAQYHLRQTCVFLNLYPVNRPEIFANAFTDFDANGDLVQEKVEKLIAEQLHSLVSMVKRHAEQFSIPN